MNSSTLPMALLSPFTVWLSPAVCSPDVTMHLVLFLRYVTNINLVRCRFYLPSTWLVNYLILILGCNRNCPNQFATVDGRELKFVSYFETQVRTFSSLSVTYCKYRWFRDGRGAGMTSVPSSTATASFLHFAVWCKDLYCCACSTLFDMCVWFHNELRNTFCVFKCSGLPCSLAAVSTAYCWQVLSVGGLHSHYFT